MEIIQIKHILKLSLQFQYSPYISDTQKCVVSSFILSSIRNNSGCMFTVQCWTGLHNKLKCKSATQGLSPYTSL